MNEDFIRSFTHLIRLPTHSKIDFSYHEFPPFSYCENGESKGLMVDMVKLICLEMSEECDFVFYSNRRAKNMKQGIMSGNFPLDWNIKRGATLTLYHNGSFSLFVKKGGFFRKDQQNPFKQTQHSSLSS